MDNSDLESLANWLQKKNALMCTSMMLSHGKCKPDAKKALLHLNEVLSTLNSNVKVLDKNTFGHVPTRQEMIKNALSK